MLSKRKEERRGVLDLLQGDDGLLEKLTDNMLSTVDMIISNGHMQVRPSVDNTHRDVLWQGSLAHGLSTGRENNN